MAEMEQVFQLEEGKSFVWKGDTYVLVRHEEDYNTVVRRTVDVQGHFVDSSEENFNGCCWVFPVVNCNVPPRAA